MKKLLPSLLSVFLVTTVSSAATFQVDDLRGKIYNVSKMPSKNLRLVIDVSCHYKTDLGMKWARCGRHKAYSELRRVPGTIENQVEFKGFSFKADKPLWAKPRFSAFVYLELKKKNGYEQPNFFEIYHFENPENATAELLGVMQELTFFFLARKKVEFVLSDGQSALPFIRSKMKAKDYLRFAVDPTFFSPEKSVGDSYPLSIGPDSFGDPIEEFRLPPIYFLKRGNLSKYMNELAEVHLSVAFSAQDWREKKWKHSEHLLKAWTIKVPLKDSLLPPEAARLDISDWRWPS